MVGDSCLCHPLKWTSHTRYGFPGTVEPQSMSVEVCWVLSSYIQVGEETLGTGQELASQNLL